MKAVQQASLFFLPLLVFILVIGCSRQSVQDPTPVNPGGRLVSKTDLYYNRTDYYIYENQQVKSIVRKDDKTGAVIFTQLLYYSPKGKVTSIVRQMPDRTLLDYTAEYDAENRLVNEKINPNAESVAGVYSYSYSSAGLPTKFEYHIENPASPRPGGPTYYTAEFNSDKTVSKIYKQSSDGGVEELWVSFFYENTFNPYSTLSLPVAYTYPHINAYFIPIRNLAKVTHPYATNMESTIECIYEYDAKKRITSAVVSAYTPTTQPSLGTKFLFRYED
ncbi:hypothetical protein [Spirosoma radiotolerans]|uniref:DUF4595 domain-containing protein n=1 Tax=Spirosoma radiotolerans TaxID=1379870 RepID=A0A0E3V694_9BACT|nr:hypothetical protein [Spirosoma radiotolerans]AKD54832.1 hypothetical protein SD10_07845 [Spirosoma radiotolerans]